MKIMIVNYKANGWEIITQRAHGLLAMQLAMQWEANLTGKRKAELLVAIADHDDAHTELQREDILTAQGGPLHFRMRPLTLEHGQCTMEMAMSKSRYIALLCSMHLDFIAGDPVTRNAALRQWLKTQKVMRVTWRRQLELSAEEAAADYRLLEWCDALSLLICQRENQPEERWVEISRGPDDKSYAMRQPAAGVLSVSPWPFSEDQFEIRFERREVQQLKFRSAEQFKKVFLKATIKEKAWLIKKHA